MNKQRIAILIAASIGVFACILPWSSVPLLATMNGIQTKIGKITIVLFAIPLILSMIGNRTKDLNKTLFYFTLIPGLLAGLFCGIQYYVLTTTELDNPNPLDKIIAQALTIEYGLYMAVFSGIMLPILTIVMRDPHKYVDDQPHYNLKKRMAPDRSIVNNTMAQSNNDPSVYTQKEEVEQPILKQRPQHPQPNSIDIATQKEATGTDSKPSESKIDKEDHSRFMPK